MTGPEQDFQPDDRPVVLVYGGTSGYGEGIVNALAGTGRYLAVPVSRRNGVDVQDALSVSEHFYKLEPVLDERGLAGVVYSAGLAVGCETVEDGDADAWARVFNTNALGLLHVAREAIPYLRKSQGHLISVGSIAHEIAYAGAADYCASKAAQTRIMQSLRYELLGSGIRQTSLEVGLGDTDFQRRRYEGDMARAKGHYKGIRQLQPADAGRTVAWLMDQPAHVNFDSITMKPTDQAHHGVLAKE